MAIFTKPCCLVAEDQALIALALEALLEEVGIGIAGWLEAPVAGRVLVMFTGDPAGLRLSLALQVRAVGRR